jgi:hypothetical protein
MHRKTLIALALVPTLAACTAGTTTQRPTTAPTQPRPRTVAPVRIAPPSPRVQVAPGLEGVIGANREGLIRQFGSPRLDVWEGDARKLQFSASACVLDVYLYPPAAGREPEATYVDARRVSDGQDVDRASCVAALKKR